MNLLSASSACGALRRDGYGHIGYGSENYYRFEESRAVTTSHAIESSSACEHINHDFGYDDKVARAVAVDSRGILEALRSIYHAERLVAELKKQQ